MRQIFPRCYKFFTCRCFSRTKLQDDPLFIEAFMDQKRVIVKEEEAADVYLRANDVETTFPDEGSVDMSRLTQT